MKIREISHQARLKYNRREEIKMRNRKVLGIFALALMILLANVSLAGANEVSTTAEGTVSIKADAEHLKILNDLRGTDISLGELIEKVFPEALENTPKDIIERQYKTPYVWDADTVIEPDAVVNSGGASIKATSNIGNSFNPLEFSSSSTIIPWGLHTIDYASVISFLEYHPIGSSDITIKDSVFESGTNTLYVSASGEWDGFSYGAYRTHGSHYIEDAESVPSSSSVQSYTDWLYLTGE